MIILSLGKTFVTTGWRRIGEITVVVVITVLAVVYTPLWFDCTNADHLITHILPPEDPAMVSNPPYVPWTPDSGKPKPPPR